MKDIAQRCKRRVKIIGQNMEKYISITKHIKGTRIRFVFIDSFRFLPASLEKLCSYLSDDQKFFLKNEFKDLFYLANQKGCCPYDFIDSFEKLKQKTLPTKEQFYNKLNDTNISEEDYERVKLVWKEFNCKNLGEYLNTYLRIDVGMLCDIFENFRTSMMKTHKLDPAHFISLPGYLWNAALFHSGVKLELLTDISHHLLIERGIRGGLSQCSTRFSEANNQYMDNRDTSKPEKYIVYFDCNNLYGFSMSQHLPVGGFQWHHDLTLDVRNIPDNSEIGYFLEVNLEYPENLHDKHRDLPLCPEKAVPPGGKHEKLLATLYDKQNYVIHYRSLKQALEHGLILKQTHRILKFKQEPWLKSYIELNTSLRAKANNDFEKNLYKLMNNAIYGKTMENERMHLDIRLLTDWEGKNKIEDLVSRPNFHRLSVFDKNLVGIEMKKTRIKLTKPIYVGCAILEISKTILYEFMYNFMYPLCGDKVKLLYTDTDSLIMEITDIDVYKDIIAKHTDVRFDTYDYPENNKYGILRKNNKELGKMKDENCGRIVLKFVCVRAKAYAILTTEDVTKHIKGVKKSTVTKQISVEDFENCLFKKELIKCTQNCIRSFKHNVYTVCEHKLALSPFDDKRYLIPNSIETLPWGHRNINKRKIVNKDVNDVVKRCKINE